MSMLMKFYGGFVIPRRAFIESNGNKNVEVYLKPVEIIILFIFQTNITFFNK